MAKAAQVNDKPRLRLAEYQIEAESTNKLKHADSPRDQLRFGFFGEVGGLLALVKKSQRDLAPADHNGITEEVGDALWYLSNVAVEYGTTLQDVGVEAMTELQRRLNVARTVEGELTFEEFDSLLQLCHSQLKPDGIPPLLRELATHTGQLLASSPDTTDLASQHPHHLLGRLLADLATVAAIFKQSVANIAHANIKKIKSRWPGDNPVHLPLFDEGRSKLEKFPRRFSMVFIEKRPEDGRPYVIQRLRGVNIGDRLTDNRTVPDGYRFHDVFHLAYLVHLGWSPVMRALLKLKRKSDKELDENQDGARAIIIEEGIATWIFNHAQRREYFERSDVGRLDYNILKQVVDMVDGYEVADCPLWQWERAILDGFKVFRQLVEAGGGIVRVDLVKRTLEFEKKTFEDEPQRPKPPRKVLVGALPPGNTSG